MIFIWILCTVFIFLVHNPFLGVQGLHPDVLLSFEQRVRLHGYPIEVHHNIVTEDDYILTLYRIPHGLEKAQDDRKNKSAILIVPGMGGSPMNHITIGPKLALAYYFADRDFDVWLVCVRGVDCQNPKKHKFYDWNKGPMYWKYSLHEIGFYDLAASIDHILKVTGQEKIFAIGHSAGGADLYVLVTERPQYNDKIKIITNYGGATIVKNIDYPLLRALSSIFMYFRNVIVSLGFYELFPQYIHHEIISLTRTLCADPEFKKICFNIAPGIFGNVVSTLIDEDNMELIVSSFQRLSIQQIMHYVFNLDKGDFRKFDWGPSKNMKVYGQKLPPLYNMSACTSPSAFIYGVTDSFSTPEDNWAMMDLVPNVILDYQVGPKFHHLDFIFAKNATFMVYEPTVRLFNDYDEGKIQSEIIRTNQNNRIL